jgi:hypothetical protein
MRQILLLVVVTILTGCAAVRHHEAAAPLRFDGVYQSERIDDYYYYLRFFSDGTVIEVSSTDQPEALRKWFSRGHPGVSTGVVRIEGSHLGFSVTSDVGVVDYTGEIEGDQLRLDSYSHINRHQDRRWYSFVKWQDEPKDVPDKK